MEQKIGVIKMSKLEVNEEQVAAFLNEMHALFSKHAVVMEAADGRLAAFDLEGFKQAYANLPNADLIEIVQAQHIKTNELYGQFMQRGEILMTILRDISSCKDFMAFDDLKKKARSILLAQDMVDRGEDPDKIKKMVEDQTKGVATSTIIV